MDLLDATRARWLIVCVCTYTCTGTITHPKLSSHFESSIWTTILQKWCDYSKESSVEHIHQVLRPFWFNDSTNGTTSLFCSKGSSSFILYSSSNNTTDERSSISSYFWEKFSILIINWRRNFLLLKPQKLVDKANLRENIRTATRVLLLHRLWLPEMMRFLFKKKGSSAPRSLTVPNLLDHFTNDTVRVVQRGAVNERINIRFLEPHFSWYHCCFMYNLGGEMLQSFIRGLYSLISPFPQSPCIHLIPDKNQNEQAECNIIKTTNHR